MNAEEIQLQDRPITHQSDADISSSNKPSVFLMLNCCLQGIGQLFPWNIFINAANYFSLRFCGTFFENNYQNWFGFSYSLFATINLALQVCFHTAIPQKLQIIGGLSIVMLVFFLSTLFVLWESLDGTWLFYISAISVCVITIASSTAQSGTVTLMGFLPESCMNGMMMGQAVAGVIVSINGIISVLVSADAEALCVGSGATDDEYCSSYEVDTGTAIYFSIAVATIILCIVGTVFLLKNEAIKKSSLAKSVDVLELPISEPLESIEFSSKLMTANNGIIYEDCLQYLKPICISVIITFAVTFSVFPSTTSQIQSPLMCDSNAPRWKRDLFTPITFLIFNASDFMGRFLTGSLTCVPDKAIIPCSIGRVTLVVLLMFCQTSNSRLPIVFVSEVWPLLFISLLGLSNGYLLSRCFISVPKHCPLQLLNCSGTVMVMSLFLGLLFGSGTSFIILLIRTGTV